MVRIFAVLLWALISVVFWTIVMIGAGFAGGLGVLVGMGVGLALWLPMTALLTDWLGLTRLWPHNR